MTDANLTDTLARAHFELTETDWRSATIAEKKFMRTEVRPLVNAMREFLSPIEDPELRGEAEALVRQMYAESDTAAEAQGDGTAIPVRPEAGEVANRLINLMAPRIYGSKRDAKAAFRDAKLDALSDIRTSASKAQP